MAYKHTMIFDYSSRPADGDRVRRGAGWTESMYHATPLLEADGLWYKLMDARRMALPNSTSIIGFRISDTTKNKGSLLRRVLLNGSVDAEELSDIPNMAVQLSAQASTGNMLRLTLRGLPDSWVRSGALEANAEWRKFIREYGAQIKNFHTICRKLDSNAQDIDTITAEGVVRIKAAIAGLAINNYVYLMRPKTLDHKSHGGKYRVTAMGGDALTFTVQGWTGGIGEGGRARLADTVTPNYPSDWNVDFVTSKKPGKPLFSHAGRH